MVNRIFRILNIKQTIRKIIKLRKINKRSIYARIGNKEKNKIEPKQFRPTKIVIFKNIQLKAIIICA